MTSMPSPLLPAVAEGGGDLGPGAQVRQLDRACCDYGQDGLPGRGMGKDAGVD